MIVTTMPSGDDLPKREEIKSAIEVERCVRPTRTNCRKTSHQPTMTNVGPR